MRAVKQLVGLALASALVTGAAQAQTGMGFPSFDAGAHNISGWYQMPKDQTVIGAQWNWGMASGNFLGVRFYNTSFDTEGPVEIDSETTFGVTIGRTMKTSGAWEWGPFLGGDYTSFDGGNHLGIDAGIGVGAAMGSMGGLSLVPFGTAALVHARTSVDDCPAGLDCDASDTAAGFVVGLGLRMGNGLQITPMMSFNTFEDSDSVFGVRLSFPFGRKGM